MIGLTTSTNAARVLADEGLDAAHNIAHFLGKIKGAGEGETRGNLPVGRGDVLIVDEASQVSTLDLLRITLIARDAGARVILAGDTAQLASPGNGGMMRLIAHDHGFWKLHEVRRFDEKWEQKRQPQAARGRHLRVERLQDPGPDPLRPAGCRLRPGCDVVDHRLSAGQADAAAGGQQRGGHGAVPAGAGEADRLRQAAAAGGHHPVDGNEAGTGDLIRARLNTKIDAGGQALSNRDTIRIDGWQGGGTNRAAQVVRQTAPGQWSRPFLVPAAYLQESAELAYAGNTHVAQGRTVDTGHVVVSETLGRESLYVGMTRGRESNTAHVVTGPPERPGQRQADQQAPAEAILAGAMKRDTAGLTATETIRRGAV